MLVKKFLNSVSAKFQILLDCPAKGETSELNKVIVSALEQLLQQLRSEFPRAVLSC